MNAYRFLFRGFASALDRTFLEWDGGATFTYGNLERETARVAALLTGLGLAPGDRVAAQVDKSPQALFLYLGCLRAGLAFLPLNTAYQRDELEFFLRDAEPRAVVCRPALRGVVEELAAAAAPGNPPHVFTLDAEGEGSLADAARGAPGRFDDAPAGDDDLAVIVYTSGTTGRPKGAMVTHGNLTSNAAALAEAWRVGPGDVLLHALPIFHVHGLFVGIHPLLLVGARILFQRRFDPAAVLAALPRATLLMGVPTFYARLLAEPGLTADAVRGVRLFVSGSAPLHPETFAAWRAGTGVAILERYGMSEAGMIASNPLDGERRAGTVGFPLPGVEVRVVDAAGRPLGPGRPGGIEVRGPNVFAGYWRRPERAAEDFTPDGWFRTGDLGQWSEDGYLAIVGRAKELVITGGYNVYPKEVELAIDALPGVAESAVYGIPDPDLGEAVAAAVVPRPGAALDAAGVIAALRERIAHFKVPRRVVFLDELPRNAMGKVRKGELRSAFTPGRRPRRADLKDRQPDRN
jgi:malonyl-CoA/methylmalonyl-CoA synthetase